MAIIIETCPICGHDLMNEIICTYPPIPRKSCSHCGWSWTGESEREEVIRIPFGGNANNRITVTTLNGNANNKTIVETSNDYLSINNLNNYHLIDEDCNGSLIVNLEQPSWQSPCDKCSANVKNGGSGICHCILGTPKVIC